MPKPKTTSIRSALKDRDVVETLWSSTEYLFELADAEPEPRDKGAYLRMYMDALKVLLNITDGTGKDTEALDSELQEWIGRK